MKKGKLIRIMLPLITVMFFSLMASCKCDCEKDKTETEINATTEKTASGTDTESSQTATGNGYSSGRVSGSTAGNESEEKVDTVPMGGTTSDEVRFSSSGNN